MRRFRWPVLVTGGLLVISLLAPGGAAARSRPLTISADRAAAIPAGHEWGYNDFFPRVLSVHRGATIAFSIQGFHTATLLPGGMAASTALKTLGLLKADTDDTTPNANGSTHTEESIGSLFPVPGGCGGSSHPCAFDGHTVLSSGAPLAGPVPTMNVKVNAPVGFYRFLCLIHPNMNGWLAVVPGGFHTTTRAEFATQVRSQIAHDKAAGFAAEARANVPRLKVDSLGVRTWTMTAGTGSPDGHVAVNEMLPRRLDIKRGDKVTWVSRSINEPHTVTFPTDLNTDMVPMCENGMTDTPATPIVIPPTGPQDFTCGGGPPDEVEFGGGNGVSHVTSPSTVSDSGVIASAAELASFGLPSTAAKARWSVSFASAARATYHYVCQIHDGMAGRIVVH